MIETSPLQQSLLKFVFYLNILGFNDQNPGNSQRLILMFQDQQNEIRKMNNQENEMKEMVSLQGENFQSRRPRKWIVARSLSTRLHQIGSSTILHRRWRNHCTSDSNTACLIITPNKYTSEKSVYLIGRVLCLCRHPGAFSRDYAIWFIFRWATCVCSTRTTCVTRYVARTDRLKQTMGFNVWLVVDRLHFTRIEGMTRAFQPRHIY